MCIQEFKSPRCCEVTHESNGLSNINISCIVYNHSTIAPFLQKNLVSKHALMSEMSLLFFYIVLYFFAELLGLGTDGAANTGVIALFDPLSRILNGNAASQWFVYGTLFHQLSESL